MLICPVVVLQFGTYMDIAAPLCSWSFPQQMLLPTLVEAQTGTKAICSTHPVCAVAICLWRVGMSALLLPACQHTRLQHVQDWHAALGVSMSALQAAEMHNCLSALAFVFCLSSICGRMLCCTYTVLYICLVHTTLSVTDAQRPESSFI